MTQSSRFDAARAVAAVLLAVGLPTLALAGTASRGPEAVPRERAAPSRVPDLSPVLEFLAQTVGTEQEAFASPHLPPGPPPGRPPASPPGQSNPPNPPGKPPDRPPGHSSGGDR
jgi:hypothetical protein